MKITHNTPPVIALHKDETKVGEIYKHVNRGELVYFRQQGGFTILNTGEVIAWCNASERGWIHVPDAYLVMPLSA